MGYLYQVIDHEPQPVLSARIVTPVSGLPEAAGRTYGAIAAYLAELGEPMVGPAFMAYYNLDMEHLDVEIGFPVVRPVKGRGELQASILPGGKRAIGYHKGPYTTMAETYAGLEKWMREKGLTPVGTAYEHYFNSPGEVSQSELLTRVEFTLR